MVALIRERSISMWFAEVLSAAVLLLASENMQRIAMMVILENILYKLVFLICDSQLRFSIANKTCDVTNQECNDVHGDNR